MENASHAVKITILGREYRINAAPEKHETLMEVRDYLDQCMRDSKKQYRLTSMENVAVITALNLAHEVLVKKETLNDHKKRLRKITQTLDGLLRATH